MMMSETNRRDMSLRRRMLLLFGFAFVLIFSCSMFLFMQGVPFLPFRGIVAIGEESALQSISELADAKKERMAYWIEERKNDVKLLSVNDAIKRNLRRIIAGYAAGHDPSGSAEFRNILLLCRSMLDAHDAYQKIQIADPKTGRIILSTKGVETGSYLPDRTRFVDVPFASEDAIIAIEQGGEEGRLFFTTAQYVSTPGEERAIGVVIFYSDMGTTITPILHTGIGMGESGEVVLVDQDGRILAPLKYRLPDGTSAAPLEYINRAKPASLASTGVEGLISTDDYRGVSVLAATRHIRISTETSWGMVVKKDRQEILTPIKRSLLSQAFLMVLSLCTLFAVTYVIALSVSKPIRLLAEAAMRIKAGDFEKRSEAGGFREVNALTESFNSMAEQLKTSYTSVENLHKEIAERKQAENEILRSKQFSDSIINSLPGIFYVFDRKGHFLRVNERFLSVSAYSLEEVLHMHPLDFFPADEKRTVEDRIREVFDTGESSVEAHLLSKDGTEIPYYFTGYCAMIDDAPLLVGLGIDITGRKRAEKALFAAELNYRKLLEDVHLLAVMLDLEGNITFCNDYLLGLTGWTKAEVLNRNWFDLFLSGDVQNIVHAVFLSGISDGALPLHHENDIVTREGTERHVVWNNSILKDPDGNIAGVASIGIDVTEHRKLEEQLRQAQKMESIGTFAGGVAHDFNNILTAIIGYGTLTLMKMSKDDPFRPNIEQMLQAADRATHLTKDLLLFSRKQPLDRKPIDLNEGIQKLGKFLVRVIGEDIGFKISLSGGTIPVLADEHQIGQVLMNLATNARDAMPKGGAFTIATEQVHLDEGFTANYGLGAPGRYALITVSDTGHGMEEETRQRIFEPFYTTKEVGKGTGLGLAVVYGIVKQHEGHITVYSEPGQGTTFRIYLPLFSPGVDEEEKPVEEHPAGGTETILVAEDNEAVRKLTVSVLREFGYNVITAVDGEDAVMKFREHKDHIQLLLFDLIMPKKSGKEAYDEIRKTRPEIRAIFASGYAPDIVQDKAALGHDATIVYKPISPTDLLRRVRIALAEGNR